MVYDKQASGMKYLYNLIVWTHMYLLSSFFSSLPSSGIASCSWTADTVMCLTHLDQPCYVALGRALGRGLYPEVTLCWEPRLGTSLQVDVALSLPSPSHEKHLYK